jgi:predicted acylesterase/phospholipase RssA
VLATRARAGSRPGARQDGFRVALAVEGGGMRGTISAGMALALDELGLVTAFDAVYGASAGAITPPGCSAGRKAYAGGQNPPTPGPSSAAPACCAAARWPMSGR